MGRWTAPVTGLAVGLLVSGAAYDSTRSVAAPSSSASSRQALRTCVDRWNRGNMLRWTSVSARISIRGLDARERSRLSIPNPLQPRCTLSLADRPGDNSWICRIEVSGGYDCPLITSDGMPPLRHANATTDRRGILTLDRPLAGTHLTPPLAWQRLYPHVDGFISPWTRAGSLRTGLTFDGAAGRHYRGSCIQGSQHTVAKAALKCASDVQFDPCFAPTGNWNHPGAIVACASAGSTSFGRFVIVRRS